MKVIAQNGYTFISGIQESMISDISRVLSFKDKSKEYQLSRMARNPFARNSKAYAQLKSEVTTTLVENTDDGIKIPTGVLEVTGLVPTEDLRSETGVKIALPWINQDKRELRSYQKEAIDAAMASHRGIINLATGLGKSLVAINIIRQVKRKTLVIAPSKSIAKQLHDELVFFFGKNKVGFYGDGKKKKADVTVGIAQTVVKHTQEFQDIGLVICDEAHRTASDTFVSILNDLSSVGRIYGLTATAYRSDGKDLLLQAACGQILVQYDAAWGIANGYLAQPVFIMRRIKTNAPDYDDKLMAYKSHILSAKEISSRVEQDAMKMMKAGKTTLVLVDTIEHGEQLEKALGVPFARGDDKQSGSYIQQLNDKKIPGLVATEGVAAEGVDTRSVECLIMAQFTAAKGPVLQAVGRALRKQDGKTHAFILDYWPTSSKMLGRHAQRRVEYYQEITDQVKVIDQ